MQVGKRKKWQRIMATGILLVLAWACGYNSAGGEWSDGQPHALSPAKASAAAVKAPTKVENVRLAASNAPGSARNAAAAGAAAGMKAAQIIMAQKAVSDVKAEAAKPAAPAAPDKSANTKPPAKKTVMLTFDDGPDGNYTPQILEILKKNDVKATFFVVGTQVKKYPKTLKRIVDEGHAVGNHTFHHANLSKATKAGIIGEIETNDAVIKKAIGYTPALFRAPYGALSPTLRSVLKDEHRKLVGWNVDTRDWAGNSVDTMRTMIQNKTKPGSIILMHCFGSKYLEHTVELLPLLIKDLKSKGYTFVTVT